MTVNITIRAALLASAACLSGPVMAQESTNAPATTAGYSDSAEMVE